MLISPPIQLGHKVIRVAVVAVAVSSVFSPFVYAQDFVGQEVNSFGSIVDDGFEQSPSWSIPEVGSGPYENVYGYLLNLRNISSSGTVSISNAWLKLSGNAQVSNNVTTVLIDSKSTRSFTASKGGLLLDNVNLNSSNKVSAVGARYLDASMFASEENPNATLYIRENTLKSVNNTKIVGAVRISAVDLVLAGGSFGLYATDNTTQLTDTMAEQADAYGIYVSQSSGSSVSDFETSGNSLSVTGSSQLKSATAAYVERNNGARIRAIGSNKLTLQADSGKSVKISGDVSVVSLRVPGTEYVQTSQITDNTLELLGNVEVAGKVSVVDTNIANFDLFGKPNVYANNNISVSGANNKVGGLEGFQNLSFTLTDANKSSNANVDISKAALTVTGPTTISAKQKILIGGSINETETYNLIGVEGADASLTIEKGTKVTVPTTFVNQNLEVINGDLTYEDGGVFAIPNDSLGQPGGTEEPDPEDPTDPSEPVTPDDPQEPGGEQGGELVDVGTTATENSKTLSESYLGTMAFVNQGAEFIADEGLDAMVRAATVSDVASFAAIQGGSSNYNTGSRVDVDGYTLVAGASVKVAPNWVLGGFLEAGWADSDSHVNRAKGEADHDYYGVGVATRYMFNDSFYVDGSLRVGQASTEFKGLYAQDSAKYDSDVFYSTMHIGAGYIVPLTQSTNLDVYGRYMLSYLDGDKVDLHNKYNDELDLDSTLTHAVRIGGRMTGTFCPYAGWKVGLAYEHVFDGDAESAVSGLNLEVPSLEGDTAIMELGVTMKPSQNSPWSMDLGAKGYAGDREGVTGNIVVRYAF